MMQPNERNQSSTDENVDFMDYRLAGSDRVNGGVDIKMPSEMQEALVETTEIMETIDEDQQQEQQQNEYENADCTQEDYDEDANNQYIDEKGNQFYEIDGLPEDDSNDADDDQQNHHNHEKIMREYGYPAKTTRVKFATNQPIRVYETFSTIEYDRRNEDIDPIGASAEYELEKRIERMEVFEVELERGSEGLGLSIIGN